MLIKFVSWIIVLIDVKQSNAEYHEVYKLYTIEESDFIPLNEDYVKICGGKINPFAKDADFVKNGLSGIFWRDISSIKIANLPEESQKCLNHAKDVRKKMKKADKFALKFLDTSSSAPAGILEGTLTNLGDFDGCINIQNFKSDANEVFGGKYFHLVAYLVNRTKPSARVIDGEQVALINEAGVDDVGVTLSLCLPDTCANDDLFAILKEIFKCYPDIHLINDISSDTRQTVSFAYKFEKISALQKIAMYILASTITLTIIATITGLNVPIIASFDAKENAYDLFYVKKGESVRNFFLDANKSGVIYCAILAHIVSCAESPRMVAMLSHLNFPRDLTRNVLVQVLAFEGGFTGLAFFSGIATFNEIYPMIKKDEYPFLKMIFNKWFRYLPAFIGLLSLELIWPLVANGPMYNQVASYNTDKVERYWWTVLLFVSNFNDIIYTPVLHTNYSMIDFQLFILGLFALYLLVKSPKKGVLFSIFMIIAGYSSLAFFMNKYNIQPHFIHPSASVKGTLTMLRYVHFNFHTYLPMYFTGILTAYSVKILKFRYTNWWNCVYGCLICYIAALSFPAFYFWFKIIPEKWTPLYLISQKLIMAGAIIFNYLRDDIEEEELIKINEGKEKKEIMRYQEDQFLFEVVIWKLAVAAYLANYWWVRLDFFTRREIWYSGLYFLWTRMAYGLIFILVLGTLFHLTFVAPFVKIRKLIMGNEMKHVHED